MKQILDNTFKIALNRCINKLNKYINENGSLLVILDV